MINKEIQAEVEKLSTEFKVKMSDHFKSKGIVVHLKNLNFSIEQSKLNKDNLKTTNTDSINFSLNCRLNSQGQVVCE